MKKLIFFLLIILLFISCESKPKYYTRRTVTASVTNNGEEKEVYRIVEIRELETNKLVERQERIVENYY